MDEQTFRFHVAERQTVSEETSCLEMFSYSDPSLNSVVQQPLSGDDRQNFLHRQGVFAPAILPDNVHLVAGVRLLLQVNAKHPETFAPKHISMKPAEYIEMVDALHLPKIAIESSSVLSPFFWCAMDSDEDNPHLQMVFRRSGVGQKGRTRGWEVILSHEFRTGLTTGFCKGTEHTDMVECVKQLKSCIAEVGHALLLPMIIIGLDSSSRNDIKQRDARDWLRKFEHSLSMREYGGDGEGYASADGHLDLNAINRDLVECHAQTLWKSPEDYLAVIETIEEAAQLFQEMLPSERESPTMRKFQRSIISRLAFYRKRWKGIETYANVTRQRLEIQRNALYNVIAQKESRLNLQIAADQKKLAHISKRESEAMKGISILGTIFLPGAFLASIFSTTFFNFQDPPDLASVVSPVFWLYWAVTIPFTLAVMALYLVWERRRSKRYLREDIDLEMSMDKLEAAIMASMRQRTLTRVRTWAIRNERQATLATDEENDYGASKDFDGGAGTKAPDRLAVPLAR